MDTLSTLAILAVILILVYVLSTLLTDPAESRRRIFTERFSAEYPGVQVIEESSKERIIRRGNNSFLVTLNEKDKFVEEPL